MGPLLRSEVYSDTDNSNSYASSFTSESFAHCGRNLNRTDSVSERYYTTFSLVLASEERNCATDDENLVIIFNVIKLEKTKVTKLFSSAV